MTAEPTRPGLPTWLLVIHWIIIVNFLLQVFYGGYMTFTAIRPEGVSGPLWGAASLLEPEQMMIRRAYALETWVAISGLSVYVAITVMLPRLLRK